MNEQKNKSVLDLKGVTVLLPRTMETQIRQAQQKLKCGKNQVVRTALVEFFRNHEIKEATNDALVT